MTNKWQASQTLKVLVVDDDTFVLKYMRQLLNELGCYFIFEATDGEEALDVLSKNKIDLVFLDVKMTPMHGLDLLKSIRKGSYGLARDLPVVMLSSSHDDDILGTALALDCDGFLSKPTCLSALSKKLQNLERKRIEVKPVIAYQVIQTAHLIESRHGNPFHQRVFIPVNAQVISLEDLSVGHVLAIDVCTLSGGVLLTSNTLITAQHIQKLKDIRLSTQIGCIAVKQKKATRFCQDRLSGTTGVTC